MVCGIHLPAVKSRDGVKATPFFVSILGDSRLLKGEVVSFLAFCLKKAEKERSEPQSRFFGKNVLAKCPSPPSLTEHAEPQRNVLWIGERPIQRRLLGLIFPLKKLGQNSGPSVFSL